MRTLYFLVLTSFIASCTEFNYLGSTYPPTDKVEVFVTRSSVKKPFDVIGKGYIQNIVGLPPSVEEIQKKAIEKGKLKGAHGVIIEDYYLVDKFSGITSGTDSSGNSNKTTSINPTVSSGFNILFIRYRE